MSLYDEHNIILSKLCTIMIFPHHRHIFSSRIITVKYYIPLIALFSFSVTQGQHEEGCEATTRACVCAWMENVYYIAAETPAVHPRFHGKAYMRPLATRKLM